jgi:hypothetical protein
MPYSRKHRWINRHRSAQSRHDRKRHRAIRRLFTETLEKRILLTAVTGTDPVANTHSAAVSTNVSATFDQDINPATATPQTFVVHSEQGGPLIGAAATISTAGATVTLDPTSDFYPNEQVQVTATSGIRSTTGDPVVPRVWQFRAAATAGSGEFTDSGQLLGVAANNTRSLGIELGDLDGDGDLDIFMSNDTQGSRIYLNDGAAGFTDSGQSLGNFQSRNVDLGDLDGDGDLDAVEANSGGQENVVWRNDGSGVFSEAQTFGGNSSEDVRLGDLDGDGDLDAFVGTSGYNANHVYLNDGSGTFSDSGQLMGNHRTESVELGDLDGDGDLDAFVNNGYDAKRVWLNNGNGRFTDSGQMLAVHNSNGLALGDLDGDGDLDAMVGNVHNPNRLWINDGNGVFTDTGQEISGSADHSGDFALGDVDADGDLDAVVANYDVVAGSLVFLNDGTGVFDDTGPRLGPAGSNAYSVALGDLDGDGDLDIAFAYDNGFPNTVSVGRVFLNQNLTPSVTLSVDSPSIPEAEGVASITATLSAAHTQPVTVDLGFSGSATDTTDYTSSGTQIVIPTGATTGTITVTAVQDTADEPDETVIVDITGITNAQEGGVQQITTTILDDDEPAPVPDVTLSVDNSAIPEEAGVATFTATLSVVTTVEVTVDVGFSGSAAASDYTASGSQIVIAPGGTTGSVTVTAVQDTEDESDETVVVDITTVTGGNESGTQQQTTTITDDDLPVVPDVTLSVDEASIPEAAGVATFTATLSETTTVPVTVDLEMT